MFNDVTTNQLYIILLDKGIMDLEQRDSVFYGEVR